MLRSTVVDAVVLSDGDFVYCTNPVSDTYAELHAFTNDVMFSFTRCEANEYVKLEPDCQPIPL